MITVQGEIITTSSRSSLNLQEVTDASNTIDLQWSNLQKAHGRINRPSCFGQRTPLALLTVISNFRHHSGPIENFRFEDERPLRVRNFLSYYVVQEREPGKRNSHRHSALTCFRENVVVAGTSYQM